MPQRLARRMVKINMMAKSKKGKIFILSGPSGSGKTSIHERILISSRLNRKIVRSVSMTTRDKRPGERQGRDYFFVTKKMFEYKVRAGHMLEWAKVFRHYYGTPAKYVRDILSSGKSVLLCIDVQGARQIMKKYPDAIALFVKAPSLGELQKRLSKRSTETSKDLGIRLDVAKKELKQAKNYDVVIINDKLSKACQQAEQYILTQLY